MVWLETLFRHFALGDYAVSELLATKTHRERVRGIPKLKGLDGLADALSKRGFTLTMYAMCGFANFSSLGIQIGVLLGLAPSRSRILASIAPDAMIAGFISTLQASGIAYALSQPFLLLPIHEC